MSASKFIDAVKKRLGDATPGPWYLSNEGGNSWNCVAISTRQASEEVSDEPDWDKAVIGVDCEHAHWKQVDMELIASTPRDLALLVKALEVARSTLGSIAKIAPELDEEPRHYKEVMADEALAEIDRILEGEL